mmetsp:Transcript_3248/g.6691  ORF Transcript_3248/g.6691 Transcript_3248/m.6691 type:complete len:220 (-) Transcript_3248:3378-4037(-)
MAAALSSNVFKELLKFRDLEDTFQDLENSGRLARIESSINAIYEEAQGNKHELKDNLKVIIGVLIDEVWLRKSKEKSTASAKTLSNTLSSKELKRSAESLRQSRDSRQKLDQPSLFSTLPTKSVDIRSEYRATKESKKSDDYISDFSTTRGYTFGGEKRANKVRTDSPGPGTYNPTDNTRQRTPIHYIAKSPRRIEDFMMRDDSSPGPAYYPKMNHISK